MSALERTLVMLLGLFRFKTFSELKNTHPGEFFLQLWN